MKSTRAATVIFLAQISFFIHAGQLSLKQAQEILLYKNLDMVIANNDYCKISYEESEAKAAWYPSLDIVGSSGYFSEKNTITFPGVLPPPIGGSKQPLGTRYRAEAGVDLSWPLTAAFVNLYNVRYRHLALTSKEAQNQGLKNQLSFRLGILYLSWILSYQQADVYKTLVSQLSEQVTQMQNLAAGGLAPSSRVLEVKASLAGAQADLVGALNQADSLRLDLVNFIQCADTDIVPQDYSFPGDSASLFALDTLSLNVGRPELTALDISINQLSVFQNILTGQKYPNLVAVVGCRYANPGLNMGDSVFMAYAQAGLQLRWNLFDGGKVSSQHRQTEQQIEIAQKQRQQMVDNWTAAIQNAKLQLTRSLRQQEAAEASLRAANALVADSKNNLSAGIATQTDYLNALTSQARAALGVKTAQSQKNRAILQLYFQAGKELNY